MPVAERMLKLKMALSTLASATTGGTFCTSSFKPVTGIFATHIPSSEARTCGAPQRKTNALRTSQGIQARRTAPTVSGMACAVTTGGGPVSALRAGMLVIGTAGRQILRNRARLAIETMAATMSTSQGP